VGSPNLKVQYDIYHAQRMEGELGNTLTKHLAQIGHIQLADNPGRGEPGTGEINYPWLFKHIDSLGLRRLDRLRIQAAHRHRERPGLARSAHAINDNFRSEKET
jgi:sugar phosphate isomerase/epimerase